MGETLPRLAPGWTEHTAPTGHKYYYNSSLKKSTYKRPTAQPTEPTTTDQTPLTQTAPETSVTEKPKETAVTITEWSSEMAVDADNVADEPPASLLGHDVMWQKLEDRPRKKYVHQRQRSNFLDREFQGQSHGSK